MGQRGGTALRVALTRECRQVRSPGKKGTRNPHACACGHAQPPVHTRTCGPGAAAHLATDRDERRKCPYGSYGRQNTTKDRTRRIALYKRTWPVCGKQWGALKRSPYHTRHTSIGHMVHTSRTASLMSTRYTQVYTRTQSSRDGTHHGTQHTQHTQGRQRLRRMHSATT